MMLGFRARARLRRRILFAAPLLVRPASTTSDFADCEHFTPFGQLSDCRFALLLP